MPRSWPTNPLLYEINARVWLEELERGRAPGRGPQAPLRLDEVPEEELLRLKEHGWHGVWLMGVWARSPAGREVARALPELREEYQRALPDVTEEDIVGSPYAVAGYTVMPEVGGDEALRRFRERLGGHGLRLMLDFVPNHLARDHSWVEECPEAFVQGSEEDLAREPRNYFRGPGRRIFAHGRDPYFPGWSDTVQIDYASPLARGRMLGELMRVAGLCDGVRCDMAMLLLPDVFQNTWGGRLGAEPEDFWGGAIAAVRARHPGFLFLAEAYWGREPDLQRAGFDYTYDKELYDRLRAGDAAGARAHLGARADDQRRCARFLENHDEPRAASAFGPGRWRAAAAATYCAPGLKLFHEGQIEGRKVKLPVQLGRRPAEEADPEVERGYLGLLSVLREPLFRSGAFSLLEVRPAGPEDSSNEAIVALAWSPPEGGAGGHLVAANLGSRPAYGRIPFPRAYGEGGWTLRDHWDGSRYEREGGEMVSPGLFVALAPDQVHLFQMAPSG